jgi:beta-N-acetylhexosaminidase
VTRGRAAAVALVAALVAAGLLVQAGTTGAVPTRTVPKPPIVWKPIVFGAKRKAEMRAYAIRHYGIASWRLTPHVIVEHYTADESFSSTYNYFAGDTPDVELGELPGVCSHFVIDKDGTIYQLVALTIMCRHTVGLNYTAIGIEHVGTSDREILGNPRQLRASLRLTLWLMQAERIQLRNVIGHNESLTSPYHRELYAPWRCQTHGDWTRADMDVYRSKLAATAKSYGVPLGPSAVRVTPKC